MMAPDTARTAGLLVIGSLAVLVLLRKGFAGVRISVGD